MAKIFGSNGIFVNQCGFYIFDTFGGYLASAIVSKFESGISHWPFPRLQPNQV